ncbi:hypothetical protein ERJ75_001632300 [Trypanosoma vivax]|nr:hypothetical protein ERJ75_001632300 [Trypanosoma vivax]
MRNRNAGRRSQLPCRPLARHTADVAKGHAARAASPLAQPAPAARGTRPSHLKGHRAWGREANNRARFGPAAPREGATASATAATALVARRGTGNCGWRAERFGVMKGSGFRRATACAKTVATKEARVPVAANRECARMSGDDWLARGTWTRHGAAWQAQRKTASRKGTHRCSTEPAERRRSEGQPPEGGHDDSRRTRRRLGRARDAALKTQKDKPASSSREGSARGSHQHPVAPRRTGEAGEYQRRSSRGREDKSRNH